MTFSSVGHGGEEGRGSFLLLADAGEKGSAWAGWRGQGVTLGVMDGGLSPGSGRGQLAPESGGGGKGDRLCLGSTSPSDQLQRSINHCQAAAAEHVTLAN